jgi:hypothetical protein
MNGPTGKAGCSRMAYKLRFVQKFSHKDKENFLRLEKEFIKFEKNNPSMPQGTRYLPVSGKESTNTLIWECTFDTLESLTKQFQAIYSNCDHENLLNQQVLYMQDCFAEIYEEITL